MNRLIAFAMTLICTPAFADQFYLTAHLACDASKPELVISFRGSWNADGEAIIANLGAGDINPRELITFTQDSAGKYLVTEKVDRKICAMDGQSYAVEFSPFTAPRFHPEGFCATRIGTRVVVKLGGNIIATASIDACTNVGTVIRSITLTPGRAPVYQEVSARQFYGT